MPANSRGVKLAATALIALACGEPPPLPSVARAGPALGAMFSVAAWGPDSARLAAAVGAAFDSVAAVDSLLSVDRPASELSRINQEAGAPPRQVSPTLAAVLGAGLAVSRGSRGAYAPAEASHRGGGVTLDTTRGTVALARGAKLDLDPLARGYALDRAALALSPASDSAVLDLGGQYLIIGGKAARGIGIPDPENDFKLLALVGVAAGHALATAARPKGGGEGESSGDLRDPRTGRPATRARSVTVVARTGVSAAAWSRAFFMVGCDTAMAQAAAVRVAVVCADAQGGVRWTDDLTGRVQQAK